MIKYLFIIAFTLLACSDKNKKEHVSSEKQKKESPINFWIEDFSFKNGILTVDLNSQYSDEYSVQMVTQIWIKGGLIADLSFPMKLGQGKQVIDLKNYPMEYNNSINYADFIPHKEGFLSLLNNKDTIQQILFYPSWGNFSADNFSFGKRLFGGIHFKNFPFLSKEEILESQVLRAFTEYSENIINDSTVRRQWFYSNGNIIADVTYINDKILDPFATYTNRGELIDSIFFYPSGSFRSVRW